MGSAVRKQLGRDYRGLDVRRFWLYLLLSVFLCGTLGLTAFGIEVAIEGPTKAAPGDLVILSAKAPGATNYAWILANSSKTFLPVENGTKAVFASGAQGKYIFVLSASDATGLGSVKHELIIGTPEPEPEPNPPGPIPPPTPLPDGKYKLASFAYSEALKVPADIRKRTATNLANSFGSISAAIAAGTLTLPEKILAETLSSNQSILGPDKSAWSPWGVSLGKQLETFDAAGTLRTAADFGVAWDEVKRGLLEAAK